MLGDIVAVVVLVVVFVERRIGTGTLVLGLYIRFVASALADDKTSWQCVVLYESRG